MSLMPIQALRRPGFCNGALDFVRMRFFAIGHYAEDALALVRGGRLGALFMRGGRASLVLANQSAAISSAWSSSSVVSDALTFLPASDQHAIPTRAIPQIQTDRHLLLCKIIALLRRCGANLLHCRSSLSLALRARR
jgi:hypothetical protein